MVIDFNRYGDKDMCRILSNLRQKEPYELLKETGTANSIPVNLDKILDFYNIQKIEMDFSELEEIHGCEPGDIYGAVFSENDDLGIFVNEKNSSEIKRFTIAHELAHCCMDTASVKETHLEFRKESSKRKDTEKRMNEFAAALLMPEALLIRAIKSMQAPTIKSLARKFQVPDRAMEKRLKSLNYI